MNKAPYDLEELEFNVTQLYEWALTQEKEVALQALVLLAEKITEKIILRKRQALYFTEEKLLNTAKIYEGKADRLNFKLLTVQKLMREVEETL